MNGTAPAMGRRVEGGSTAHDSLSVVSVWRASSDPQVLRDLGDLHEMDEFGLLLWRAVETEKLAIAARRGSDVVAAALDALPDRGPSPVRAALQSFWRTLGLRWTTYPLRRVRRAQGARTTFAAIRELERGPVLFLSGEPEEVFARCLALPPAARSQLRQEASFGRRVIAVASRALAHEEVDVTFDQLETGMTLLGLIAFEVA